MSLMYYMDMINIDSKGELLSFKTRDNGHSNYLIYLTVSNIDVYSLTVR